MKKILIMLGVILLLAACGGDDFPISKPTDVRNDTTDSWRIATTSDSINVKDYIKEYSEKYIKDGETHFIINFNKNTTSVINKQGGTLFVDVYEYVKGEEHDAKKLPSGIELISYMVNDDGSIEEIN